MSATEQKETEFISGVIEGIVQKGPDKWQVAVKPDGSQYTKNLWTKDADLVESLSVKIGSQGAFVCGVSHWTTNDGKPVRSLWIQGESDGPSNVQAQNLSGSVATPDAAAWVPKSDPGATLKPRPPVLGGDKDRLIVRQVCIKAGAELLAGRVAEDAALDVMKAAQRFETWIYRDIADVPFEERERDGATPLSEHDQSIPY